MARYRRRRVRTRRPRRKTRRGMRRSTRRAGARRYRPITQGRVFTMSRTAEVALVNGANAGVPVVGSSDVTYLAVGADDITTITLPHHKNFGIFFNDRLQALQAYTDFTNLFQYFRITKISRRWVPMFPATGRERGYYNENTIGPDTQSMGAFAIPTLLSLTDKDDNAVVTAASARETMGIRRIKMAGSFTETFSPVPSMPVGATTGGGSLFAVIPKRCPWMNIDDASNISVYGKRYGVLDWPGPSDGVGDVVGNIVPYGWRIYTTYTVQFKGIR